MITGWMRNPVSGFRSHQRSMQGKKPGFLKELD
jgi:hypothetical protein